MRRRSWPQAGAWALPLLVCSWRFSLVVHYRCPLLGAAGCSLNTNSNLFGTTFFVFFHTKTSDSTLL